MAVEGIYKCWPSIIFKHFYTTEMCKDQELGITANWKMLRNEDPLNFSNDLRSQENGTCHTQL